MTVGHDVDDKALLGLEPIENLQGLDLAIEEAEGYW